MDSGFAGGEDETYNVYDQPFRSGRDMASNIYRPTKSIDKDAYSDDFDTLMQNNRYRGSRLFHTLCFFAFSKDTFWFFCVCVDAQLHINGVNIFEWMESSNLGQKLNWNLW